MQRSALPPIARYVDEQATEGRVPGDMRLLEVTCGTGRFHTFVKVSAHRDEIFQRHLARTCVH